MNKKIIIDFNRKIIFFFIFFLILFIAGLYASVFIEGDKKHSAEFYTFGGIYLQLIALPFLISYGKYIFTKKKAFYFNVDKFIYNYPLVDIPNPISWKDISNIKEIEVGNHKFIAISFYDNDKYINKLNSFWKYMSNFRLKKFGYPLLISSNNTMDIDFETLVKIFYDKYENSKVSNKS